MKFFITLLLCFTLLASFAQKAPYNKHWVQFKDKKDTPYSVLQPTKYLSARAIERRSVQGIPIDETDLPVSPQYVSALKATGAELMFTSKWMNGAVVICGQDTLEKIKNLPFVTGTRSIGYKQAVKERVTPIEHKRLKEYTRSDNKYGEAWNQLHQLNGDVIHKLGFEGKRIVCAIFDGGFDHVNELPAFDSIWQQGRLLGTHDFSEGDDWVFESSTHGSNVLSCMSANLPGLEVGTAPDASFYLFKTEEVKTELVVEEYNWLAAAEYSDSLGVDVINSSLGYTKYDDSTMTYKYKQLDGNTSVISRAADLLAKKGVLVCNSAGNEGSPSNKWHYIGTPADADSILAVGAVTKSGNKANFSSWGPTPDGRVKPDVASQGLASAVASMSEPYKSSTANGTSFSSPIMAGMVAALWDGFPEKSNMEVIQALRESGSQYKKPDEALGNGIPDFSKAYSKLSGGKGYALSNDPTQVNDGLVSKEFQLFIPGSENKHVKVEIYDPTGQKAATQEFDMVKGETSLLKIDMNGKPDGAYTAIVREGDRTRRVLFFKAKEILERKAP